MRRLSILKLMGFVLVVAVGFAALRASNGYWVGGLLFVTLGLLGFAILACYHGRGPARAAWLGFLVGCGGYFLSIRTLSAPELGSFPPLLLIAYGQSRYFPLDGVINISFTTVSPAGTAPPTPPTPNLSNWVVAPASNLMGWDPLLSPGSANAVFFYRVGNILFAWLFGWIGSVVSRRMWRSRDRAATGESDLG